MSGGDLINVMGSCRTGLGLALHPSPTAHSHLYPLDAGSTLGVVSFFSGAYFPVMMQEGMLRT